MSNRPQLAVSDKKGSIYNIPELIAAGMKGGRFFRLRADELIKLPYGSELFTLPYRRPVGYSPRDKRFVVLEDLFGVAAFLSPGYTISYNSPYIEFGRPRTLPLFSYGAVAFYKGGFYAAAMRVDGELRQDLRFMDIGLARKNASKFKKIFPKNRLIRHLEKCAFTYGCPAAKNFFLERYEAPLPASPYCNALCIGCISYQTKGGCSVTQPRIKFIPTPEEVAEVALYHIKNVKDPVVSFGQGCEGEPLLVGDVIEDSIKLIRKRTSKGIINLNTNGSLPSVVARLLDAGLDSIRVSMNSAREDFYNRYYKPKGYTFKDVLISTKIAKKKNGFVSINYLVMPGFTDKRDEFNAFRKLIRRYRVDMIQWRNLNYDPKRYLSELKIAGDRMEMLGMREIIYSLKKEFPKLMMGYFNPSKERIKRFRLR